MSNRKRSSVAILFILIGVIIGLTIASNFNIQTQSIAVGKEVSPESRKILSQFSSALEEVNTIASPSVVNISTTKTMQTKDHPMGKHFDDPMFKRFFGDMGPKMPKKFESQALGSGVIVREDGYILTNSHVVKGADEIKVITHDKRDFKGKVIGVDPKTDLAVIKIEAKGLPTVKIGDSDVLKVGDVVLAIGNPYGLTQTATMGIVSATGRSEVGIVDYEDFIQIDAAINPGNSGGALVNINGELVGINTAIFSTSGGYQGIGFAIPSAMAKNVMESLLTKGKVIRGWLGINIQPLTPELAKSFGIDESKGVLVADVTEDGPASKAGVKRGDLILDYDGKETAGPRQLRNMVAATTPGASATLGILREGKKTALQVKVGEMPDELAKSGAPGPDGTVAPDEYENLLKGIAVEELSAQIKKELNVPAKVSGVIIGNVDPDSQAASVLKQGDIIQEINRKKVSNLSDYKTIASSIKKEDDVLLLIFRSGSYLYLTLSAKK